jgi:imidazolonepropionase-like amidohydrolase
LTLVFAAIAALSIGITACSGSAPSELTITHVNVIPMTSENLVLEDQDVVIARLEGVVDFNGRLVREFSAAGITLLAGTDASIPGVMPGFALHDELESLVAAGLTNWQALAAATVTPARWLGTDADRGTVETGKTANFVLLDASPLDQIANSRRIAAVLLGGRYLSKDELDGHMRAFAARFTN